MLIAKSLGTNAARLAADRSLPAVWLTPLLSTPWITAALGRATAPMLLVGGTADLPGTVRWPTASPRTCSRLAPVVIARW